MEATQQQATPTKNEVTADFMSAPKPVQKAVGFYASIINGVMFDDAPRLAAFLADKQGYTLKRSASAEADKKLRQEADSALSILIHHYAPGGLSPELIYALCLARYAGTFKMEKKQVEPPQDTDPQLGQAKKSGRQSAASTPKSPNGSSRKGENPNSDKGSATIRA